MRGQPLLLLPEQEVRRIRRVHDVDVLDARLVLLVDALEHALGAGALDLDVDLRILRLETPSATASATFTSTEVYQTTLPSFAAASTIAGVVSWASAGIATALDASSPDISKRAIRSFIFPPRGVVIAMRTPAAMLLFARPRQSSGSKRTPTRASGGTSMRAGAATSSFLPDVDDVVAVAAEISLAAHDARQHVVRFARIARAAARDRASSRRCSFRSRRRRSRRDRRRARGRDFHARCRRRGARRARCCRR